MRREYRDVKQERQKTYFDRSRYGPSYKVVEEMLVFNPKVKTRETRELTSFYREAYTIDEL